MTFSGASSAVGYYTPQYSSNFSKLTKPSDLFQTSKFYRGVAAGFVLTPDRGLTSLIQNQTVALTVLANFSPNDRVCYWDLG